VGAGREPGTGHHGSVQEGQDVAGFIQRGDGVVITGDNHQMTAGLLQIYHEAVVQLTRIAWRRTGVENVTRNNNRIHFVRSGRIQQPVQERFMLRCPAFAVKVLTQMPVRSVKYAHRRSVAKKDVGDYKHSGGRK
jgi:hypothetical protein